MKKLLQEKYNGSNKYKNKTTKRKYNFNYYHKSKNETS